MEKNVVVRTARASKYPHLAGKGQPACEPHGRVFAGRSLKFGCPTLWSGSKFVTPNVMGEGQFVIPAAVMRRFADADPRRVVGRFVNVS